MTNARFTDYPRNGEGLSVYDPQGGERHMYPAGTELLFNVGGETAFLDHDDLVRLHATIETHLDERSVGNFDHDSV